MSMQAYQQAAKVSETPSQTEYRLFTEVTRSLIKAKESGERDQGFFKALDWNRRMWSVLSTDCGAEGNQLPKELRAGIISLAIWVSKYSSEVARGDQDIDALIDVNRNVMEGLAMQMRPKEQPSQAQQPQNQAELDAARQKLAAFSAEV